MTNDFTDTNIDFNKYQIIAVFDQIYENGGYSIDITNVIVKVENLLTGGINSIFNQPFHIIKISKSGKPILFE